MTYFSPSPVHILCYLNFRISFWCLKSKTFYNISLARLFRNREIFPWNLIAYLWQGEKCTNYPCLYLYVSLYMYWVWKCGKRYSPKINSNQTVWKCCSILKRLSGNWHSDPFFHFERDLNPGRQSSTSRWPPVHCPLEKAAALPPATWGCSGAERWAERSVCCAVFSQLLEIRELEWL